MFSCSGDHIWFVSGIMTSFPITIRISVMLRPIAYSKTNLGQKATKSVYFSKVSSCTCCLLSLKMAKWSSVLRNIFGFFNLLFAIVGVGVFVLALLVHVHLSNLHEFEKIRGLALVYVVGFIILAISFLGAYGAFRQVKWMLVLFLVLMCVGFLFLVRVAVVSIVFQPKVNDMVEEQLKAVLPLDRISEDFQELMNGIQNSMQCCGLFNGYHDWNENVPESCNCNFTEETVASACVPLPGYSSEVFFIQPQREVRMVFAQSCGPLLLTFVKKVFACFVGVFTGLTVLTVLAIVMSSCLIVQINRNRSAGVVIFHPSVISTTNKYTELINDVPHY